MYSVETFLACEIENVISNKICLNSLDSGKDKTCIFDYFRALIEEAEISNRVWCRNVESFLVCEREMQI